MKRTISGMIGTGSLAHNRRDFIAENVDMAVARMSMAAVGTDHFCVMSRA